MADDIDGTSGLYMETVLFSSRKMFRTKHLSDFDKRPRRSIWPCCCYKPNCPGGQTRPAERSSRSPRARESNGLPLRTSANASEPVATPPMLKSPLLSLINAG